MKQLKMKTVFIFFLNLVECHRWCSSGALPLMKAETVGLKQAQHRGTLQKAGVWHSVMSSIKYTCRVRGKGKEISFHSCYYHYSANRLESVF